MSNVINFKEKYVPDDLMTFKELNDKHGYKYGYLYKWSCLEGKLTVYSTGTLKLSEREVLEFDKMRTEKKYGGHK